ncbi:MAG TPA: hypothetical protein VNK26_02220, partial [Pyrinomonadaceae bacterium]|nr:hypothetical protein [Pyrinomonadaceae bacterium]
SGSSFYLPILIGLGADDFSVNLSAIRGIRAAVKQISVNDAAELANRALEMDKAEEIEAFTRQFITKKWPDLLPDY